MPNSKTFRIKAIRNLIIKYLPKEGLILDPFANECSIKQLIPSNLKYISNDLDTEFKTDFNLEAQDFMNMFDENSIDMILFDPPYSGRQVSECYKKLGKTVTMSDTNSGYFTKFKKEISRLIKKNGYVITFGWNSNGIGKKYGFEIVEILLVAHGSMHNDTIITVEKKINRTVSNFTQGATPSFNKDLKEKEKC
jgi:DNA modification methylase